MASSNNLAADIAAVVAPYYHETSLMERPFDNDIWGEAKKFPYEGGETIHMHRWGKLPLGERLADGSDAGTGMTMDATDLIMLLDSYGSFVNVPRFGDLVRFKKIAVEARPKLREQSERTAWAKEGIGLRQAIHGGAASMTKNTGSFDAARVIYANNRAAFANLVAGDRLSKEEIKRGVALGRKLGAPKTEPVLITNAWGEAALFNDPVFETMMSRGDWSLLVKGKLPRYAGARISMMDEPLREQIAGTENTHVGHAASDVISHGATVGQGDTADQQVFTSYLVWPEAIGFSQVYGRDGMVPKFKIQDITRTGSNMTIGYYVDFVPIVLNKDWIIVIKHVEPTDLVPTL